MQEESRPRLWIELDDLIRYFDTSATPTGVGRVQLEVIPRLLASCPDGIGLCRIGTKPHDARVVRTDQLTSLMTVPAFLQAKRSSSFLALWIERISRFLERKARAVLDRRFSAAQDCKAFRDTVRAGDIIVSLGASWTHKNYGRSLRALKAQHGVRFAVLVHDILPLAYPDMVSTSFRPLFAGWFSEMIETWDAVLTPSRNVAGLIDTHLRSIGVLPPPISPIPFGFGFADSSTLAATTPIGGGPYALFVSTIEIRKNHMLLYRVWERLIAKHGDTQIPKLVFAGSMGWDVDDLRKALAASDNLNGKIQIVSNMSDAQLARAYADCQFTLFPSFCEGWGLPVSESLFHGKLCVASNATSIPEIGGPAVDYFDPHNEDEAFVRIERVLFEPGYLKSREAWIAENFRLPTWDGTAQAIVEALLDAPAPAPLAVY